MTLLSEMYKNSRHVIQKVRSKFTDRKIEKKEISDSQMVKALGETLLGMSIHPKALLKSITKKDK